MENNQKKENETQLKVSSLLMLLSCLRSDLNLFEFKQLHRGINFFYITGIKWRILLQWSVFFIRGRRLFQELSSLVRCLFGGGTCFRAVLIGINVVTSLTHNLNKKSQTIFCQIDPTNNIINIHCCLVSYVIMIISRLDLSKNKITRIWNGLLKKFSGLKYL